MDAKCTFPLRFGGVLLLLLFALGCSRPDSAASRFAAAPKRICSVNLGADELLYELVGVERVVAVNAFVDDPGLSNVAGKFPPELPRVRAELEQIVALRPDLVCVNPFNSADFLDILQKSGLPYFRHNELTSFDGIRNCIIALGARVGEPARAKEIVDSMDRRLSAVDGKLVNLEKKPRVYYWAASWTAGKNSTIDEVIRRAGGVNAGAESGREGMYELSMEQILAIDPDILLLDARDTLAELPGRELPPQLHQLRAYQQKQVLYIPGRALCAVSHHIVTGVELLAKALHPERFAANGATSLQNVGAAAAPAGGASK